MFVRCLLKLAHIFLSFFFLAARIVCHRMLCQVFVFPTRIHENRLRSVTSTISVPPSRPPHSTRKERDVGEGGRERTNLPEDVGGRAQRDRLYSLDLI